MSQMKKTRKIAMAIILAFSMASFASAAEISSLIPIGHTVGIKMSADGVLVVRLNEVITANGKSMPAQDAGLEEGDLITAINGQPIASNDMLQKQISLSAGEQITLDIIRNGQEKTFSVTPCADEKGLFRIGVLARDSMAGIGTLTYVDPETGAYGSLGHGICESETGVLMPLKEGTLLYSVVGSVNKGKSGEPGSLQGEFAQDHEVGTVTENTESGIFGTLTESGLFDSLQAYPVAKPDEIQLGDAEIFSNIEGDTVEKYAIQIEKVYPADDEYGRGMSIRVTDERLLEKTGGIVQGMSGSPVIQNGKIIGAVTHVLVNDPTSGYAISIEKMIEEMTN